MKFKFAWASVYNPGTQTTEVECESRRVGCTGRYQPVQVSVNILDSQLSPAAFKAFVELEQEQHIARWSSV